MPKFSTKSLEKLETCHQDLQTLMKEVVKYYDITILEGIRTLEKQQYYYRTGKSQLDGIHKKSKHQGRYDENGNFVSFAVDIMPYRKGFNPFNERCYKSFYYLGGFVFGMWDKLLTEGRLTGLYKLRWGGDWRGQKKFDSHFVDLPHYELVRV